MPVKVKTNLKTLEKLTSDVRGRFRKELTNGDIGYTLIRTLQDIIKKGLSPVEGEGRFQKYSESYREAIRRGDFKDKRPAPVNMTQTGEMLGSLKVEEKGEKVYLVFDDKKAYWHQNGKGKLPVRKLLPVGRFEGFNKRIIDLLVKALKKAIKK